MSHIQDRFERAPRVRATGWEPGVRRGFGGALRAVRRGLLLLTLAAAAAVVLGAAGLGALLYKHAHPPRIVVSETPEALFTKYMDATFYAADRVPLTGWWIPGRGRGPALVLGHDLGESRGSFLGLAAMLSEAGYSVLLFDFRGHGRSEGSSSFGTLEKRDLLGAIDWVAARRDADGKRIGVLGVGMGAHAAILAAGERPQVKCLILDSPYREVVSSFASARLTNGPLGRWLVRGSVLMYDIVYGVHSADQSASRRVRGLADRDLLFLAPRESASDVEASRALYDSIPDSRLHDKNLILLDATRTTNLYGPDRTRYDDAILSFFSTYLPTERSVPPDPAAAPRR